MTFDFAECKHFILQTAKSHLIYHLRMHEQTDCQNTHDNCGSWLYGEEFAWMAIWCENLI